MNIKAFYTAHNLPTTGVELRESGKTYEGTSEHILYIQLPMEVEDQDFLVCSRTLASKLRSKELSLAQAHVARGDYGYGLICPQTTKVIETIDL